MDYTPGSAYVGQLFTLNQRGEKVPAGSTPTAVLTHNGVDDGDVTLTVTEIATGRYAVTGTIPADYVEGDVIQVVAEAEIAGVLTPSLVTDMVLGANRYHFELQFNTDSNNTRDEYTLTWFKNVSPITSGITLPKLRVMKRDDTDLIAERAISEVGSTGILIYNATATSGPGSTSERITAGEAFVAESTAMIDGAVRTWRRTFYRDV